MEQNQEPKYGYLLWAHICYGQLNFDEWGRPIQKKGKSFQQNKEWSVSVYIYIEKNEHHLHFMSYKKWTQNGS